MQQLFAVFSPPLPPAWLIQSFVFTAARAPQSKGLCPAAPLSPVFEFFIFLLMLAKAVAAAPAPSPPH